MAKKHGVKKRRLIKTNFFVASPSMMALLKEAVSKELETLGKKYGFDSFYGCHDGFATGGKRVGFEMISNRISTKRTVVIVRVEGIDQNSVDGLMADLEKTFIKNAKPAKLVVSGAPEPSA